LHLLLTTKGWPAHFTLDGVIKPNEISSERFNMDLKLISSELQHRLIYPKLRQLGFSDPDGDNIKKSQEILKSNSTKMEAPPKRLAFYIIECDDTSKKTADQWRAWANKIGLRKEVDLASKLETNMSNAHLHETVHAQAVMDTCRACLSMIFLSPELYYR
jgi:hypothetical protein